MLDRAKLKSNLHANISPSHQNWVSASAGKSGLGFVYVIRRQDTDVELYIDRQNVSNEENKAIFDTLAAAQEPIEAEFGEPLEWQRLEGKHACRIKKDITVGGYRDEEKWPALQDALIDSMVRLENAFKPHISKLSL